MKQLKNKTAIITGASSGIGEATAHVLSEEGMNLVLAARREDRLNELKEKIESNGGKAIVVKTDVTERDQVDNMAQKAKDKFGSIDILINNAGLMPLSLMKNLHVDEWDQMIDVNLKGVLYCIAAVLPTMRDQQNGHIVNISSVAGRKVMPGSAVYSATKFGVRAISEGLRQELSPSDNIRITAIEPGAVDTELMDTITDEEMKDLVEESFGNIKTLESEDIAESIRYAVTQPNHVDVSEILIMPTEQK
jgi:NADP-dependent 3-hydroxy acid dehydrogenase YdfG